VVFFIAGVVLLQANDAANTPNNAENDNYPVFHCLSPFYIKYIHMLVIYTYKSTTLGDNHLFFYCVTVNEE